MTHVVVDTKDRERFGRIGYEAMLRQVKADPDISGVDADQAPQAIDEWENQCEKLREDWRVVAEAIVKAAYEDLL